jgi:hypothetical protein
MTSRPLRNRITGVIGFYLLSNVLAMAIGTIIVLAADEGESATGLMTGLGISILAAGVTGLVMSGYILVTENLRNQITVLQQFGIQDYFHENSTPIRAEYDRRLRNHNKQIDVLGLGLSKLRADFSSSFKAWAAAGDVRILLIDPTFPTQNESLASQRDAEENEQPGKIAWDVKGWIDNTEDLRKSEHNFRLRLYRALPTVTMVRIDDEIFWSPYFINRDANSTPTMLVRRGGLLFEVLAKHFDDIWNSKSIAPPAVTQPPGPLPSPNQSVDPAKSQQPNALEAPRSVEPS